MLVANDFALDNQYIGAHDVDLSRSKRYALCNVNQNTPKTIRLMRKICSLDVFPKLKYLQLRKGLQKMTTAFNEMHTVHLSYAAIFVCLCLGFLFLKFVYKNEVSPWLWAISSLCNSIGFLLWSGILSIEPSYYYLAGEIFHILGFFLFVYGALKFANVQNIKKWGIPFVIF